jgi:hypothetical protein
MGVTTFLDGNGHALKTLESRYSARASNEQRELHASRKEATWAHVKTLNVNHLVSFTKTPL